MQVLHLGHHRSLFSEAVLKEEHQAHVETTGIEAPGTSSSSEQGTWKHPGFAILNLFSKPAGTPDHSR